MPPGLDGQEGYGHWGWVFSDHFYQKEQSFALCIQLQHGPPWLRAEVKAWSGKDLTPINTQGSDPRITVAWWPWELAVNQYANSDCLKIPLGLVGMSQWTCARQNWQEWTSGTRSSLAGHKGHQAGPMLS